MKTAFAEVDCLKIETVFAREEIGETYGLGYLSICISFEETILDNMSSRIQKAQLACINLRYLCCRSYTQLPIKDLVYSAAVRSGLLPSKEMRQLRTEYLSRFSRLEYGFIEGPTTRYLALGFSRWKRH